MQPVSLDLRLGGKAYRIRTSFLPENETVEEKLKQVTMYEFDIDKEGGILEKNSIYLVPLQEELNLPAWVSGYANPKSSTGRVDMFTRVIVDHGQGFDEIRPGYRGKMYLEIVPRSFTVKVQKGLSLSQLRLYQGKPFLQNDMLKASYKKNPILFDANGNPIPLKQIKLDDGLFVSVDISGAGSKDNVVAYRAKPNSHYVDLSKVRGHKVSEFWEPIYSDGTGKLILEPDCFYIMMSKEKICIWPHLLAEMGAYEPCSGELRTHYAGFFDPGFGWNGEQDPFMQGTRAVMEVRPHDVPFMVEDGQTFCRLLFEKIIEPPEKVYGQAIKSNYHSQGLTLSKHFQD